MRHLILIAVILALTGCAKEQPKLPHETTDNRGRTYLLVCIDGVEYLRDTPYGRTDGFISPHLKTDGTPYLCDLTFKEE